MYMLDVVYDVEFANEFEEWWDGLEGDEQESVDHFIGLLIDP
jgi:hypothetical protein